MVGVGYCGDLEGPDRDGDGVGVCETAIEDRELEYER